MDPNDIKEAAIPISELFRETPTNVEVVNQELVDHFDQADVIWGWDTSTGNLMVFYGPGTLQKIARGNRASKLRLFSVKFDGFTDELELLCAFCKVRKGSCDYRSDPKWLDRLPGLRHNERTSRSGGGEGRYKETIHAGTCSLNGRPASGICMHPSGATKRRVGRSHPDRTPQPRNA